MVVFSLEIDSVPVSFSVSVATTVSFGRWGGRLRRGSKDPYCSVDTLIRGFDSIESGVCRV